MSHDDNDGVPAADPAVVTQPSADLYAQMIRDGIRFTSSAQMLRRQGPRTGWCKAWRNRRSAREIVAAILATMLPIPPRR